MKCSQNPARRACHEFTRRDFYRETQAAGKLACTGVHGLLQVAFVALECKHVWDSISEFLDDSLPAEIRELVQKHLENCEMCSAILDSTRNILVLTADHRVFELRAGYSERLHVRLTWEIRGANCRSEKSTQD